MLQIEGAFEKDRGSGSVTDTPLHHVEQLSEQGAMLCEATAHVVAGAGSFPTGWLVLELHQVQF